MFHANMVHDPAHHTAYKKSSWLKMQCEVVSMPGAWLPKLFRAATQLCTPRC
jgi:hypothetical protein